VPSYCSSPTTGATTGGALGFLWFFEALIQMSILLVVLFKSRTFARAWRSRTWFPFAVVIVAAIVKFVAWAVYDPAPLEHRTPDALLFLFAAGMALAVYRQGSIASALAGFVIVIEMLTWGARDTHAPLMVVALATLLFLRRPAVPASLGIAVRKLAASSLYIYLASPAIAYLFWRSGGDHPLLFLCATFGSGLLLDTVARRFLGWWSGRVREQSRGSREAVLADFRTVND
jgi:hypothetical protein